MRSGAWIDADWAVILRGGVRADYGTWLELYLYVSRSGVDTKGCTLREES